MMKQVILGEVLLDASFGLAEWESLVLDASTIVQLRWPDLGLVSDGSRIEDERWSWSPKGTLNQERR
jgi:hypothetical protein